MISRIFCIINFLFFKLVVPKKNMYLGGKNIQKKKKKISSRLIRNS